MQPYADLSDAIELAGETSGSALTQVSREHRFSSWLQGDANALALHQPIERFGKLDVHNDLAPIIEHDAPPGEDGFREVAEFKALTRESQVMLLPERLCSPAASRRRNQRNQMTPLSRGLSGAATRSARGCEGHTTTERPRHSA